MATSSPAESGGWRVMTVMTHALPWVLGVAVVLRIAAWFGVSTWLDVGAGAALLACTITTIVHRRSSHLCVRCMDEFPADAPVRAEQRKTVLWFCHAVTSGIGPAVSIGPAVALPVLAIVFGDPTLQRLARIPLDLLVFSVAYASWLHHRLQPWCPYCRGWDEGGDPEPSPDPTKFGTRTGR